MQTQAVILWTGFRLPVDLEVSITIWLINILEICVLQDVQKILAKVIFPATMYNVLDLVCVDSRV